MIATVKAGVSLMMKCKECQSPVTVYPAAIAGALRAGILCENCRGAKAQKWTKATYAAYLQTEHWQQTRVKALKRSGYKCQLCAATKGLDVHHNDYSRLGGEKATDLVVLCRPCHKTHHGAEF